MRLRSRTIAMMTCAAALAVFAFVQDRVTASGVREYASRQRAALAGQGTPVTIDEVMAPAVRRSVREGAAWAGSVLIAGVAASRLVGRRPRGTDRRAR